VKKKERLDAREGGQSSQPWVRRRGRTKEARHATVGTGLIERANVRGGRGDHRAESAPQKVAGRGRRAQRGGRRYFSGGGRGNTRGRREDGCIPGDDLESWRREGGGKGD